MSGAFQEFLNLGDTPQRMLTLEILNRLSRNTKPVGCALRTIEHLLAVREATMPVSDPAREVHLGIKRSRPSGAF
jgi:hypothetical protein